MRQLVIQVSSWQVIGNTRIDNFRAGANIITIAKGTFGFFIEVTVILVLCVLHISPVLAQGVAAPAAGSELCNSQPTENNHLALVPDTWLSISRTSDEEYRQRIKEIESDGGVFSYNLVPELMGLGLLNLEAGKHSDSAALFERALYVIRSNEGLYSQKQLAILDFMILSNSVVENWDKVANSYDLMYWLYKRNFSADDPRQLQALKRLRRWYMESYNKNTGRTLEQLFEASEDIYEQAIRIMWSCTNGNEAETLCFWHKSCCTDTAVDQLDCPMERQ